MAARFFTRVAAGDSTPAAPQRVLRVAADPNNLPFSNRRGEGFENRLAELIARELNARIEYTWQPQRRGFFRKNFKEGDCDVALSVPAGFERMLTTRPYFRSSYAFVYRTDRALDISSFDDPRLKTLRIGVHLIGDDGANTPPAHAMSARGITGNLVGFTVYGDYREESPLKNIIAALERGEIDLAVIWGPIAGYFANQSRVALKILPVTQLTDPLCKVPFSFSISVGVRRGESKLRDEIDAILKRKAPQIEDILRDFCVPITGPGESP